MPDCFEILESREVQRGQQPYANLLFIVRDPAHAPLSEHDALNAITDTSPTWFDLYGGGILFLPRQTVWAAPITADLWRGRASYGPVPAPAQSAAGESSEYSFDTTGATQHITTSIGQADQFRAPNVPLINYRNCIGVTDDSVEGCDIVVPQFSFNETHYLNANRITPAYKRTLRDLTGTINDAPFKGYDPFEVLFMGAQGSRRAVGDWRIDFRFQVGVTISEQNDNQFDIGFITVETKRAWDYMWVRYAKKTDISGFRYFMEPESVNVERVYRRADFSRLQIGIDP